ncbi:MAG: glycosyltransferase [Ignavibacterium sp.]|nr:glycosyltransferase [Ignavibacterium sp.]
MNYIIAVNTYNRPVKLVLRCLESCIRQAIKPIKIILIDQNENALELPDEISSNPLIKVTRVNKKSISEARNSITIPAGTDWIFFCDDDGFPDDNYSLVLNNILNKNPNLDLLGGVYLREDNKEYYNQRQKIKGGIKSFIDTKKIMGSNLVVRVSIFNELARFSPDFGVGAFWGAGEETDLVWKAYFNNKKIDFFHELIIYHPPMLSRSLRDEIKKSYNYGVGKAGLVAKWLFKKGKLFVLYELFEMFAIPAINIFIGIFTLNIKKIIISIAAITGRVSGLIKGLFYKFV